MNAFQMTSTAAIEQRLSAYHTLTTLFVVLGCVSLAAAVALFFGFHVARIMAVKLGIAARRTIREIEDANAETGGISAAARKAAQSGRGGRMWNTSQLNGEEHSSFTTGREALPGEGSGETSLLGRDDNDTAVLSVVALPPVSETSDLKEDVAVQIGRFTITREIMMIHTEERI
ncbi:MAG: hypothetical protein K2O34_03185 [Acetatifactor sp.]|nr:hypothetical protein [Acetatifactor sp.]